MQELYDYIVVGGGTAGCVVAGRLSERDDRSVLLLERGEDVSDDPTVAPTHFNAVLPPVPTGDLPVETLETLEPGLPSGRSRTYLPRALGGGPAVSGSFWGRGDPSNYDEWASDGNPGWSYAELLPYFKRSEHVKELFRPGEPVSEDRGVAGPIEVARHDPDDPHVRVVLARACEVFGVGLRGDCNTRSGQLGFGPMQRNLGHDRARPVRSSTYARFVRPWLSSRPGLQLLSGATATHLRLARQEGALRAVGVEFVVDGRSRSAAARREIVVAAGAVHSPKLLMQSGIGDADELGRWGIPVLAEVPGVGRNLQDHVVLPFRYELDGDRAWPGLPPPAEPTAVTIGFLRSPRSRWIDLELAFGILPPGVLAGFAVSLRHALRGSVTLTGADPLAEPAIRLGLDPEAPDMARYVAMFRSIRTWLLDSGLAIRELEPGVERVAPNATDAQWRSWCAERMAGWYHLAGTCRMGPSSDPQSVVDAKLKVRGVDRLRVADCSIMPRLVSSHPSASAAMIGEKAATLLLEEG